MADVRAASEPDVDAVAAIYGQVVRTSVATFDTDDPPRRSWLDRLASTEPGDHFLVASDVGGGCLGFAYSGAYRGRPAYARTRETTVYLAEPARGRGVGRALYERLLALLTADAVHLAVAVVALPNPASIALHRSLGFVEVGTMHQVGFKLGRWVDTLWLERPLGEWHQA
ncbi:MAG: GNAT family N-acetyltransferase [Dermatophilaceae bacterium]